MDCKNTNIKYQIFTGHYMSSDRYLNKEIYLFDAKKSQFYEIQKFLNMNSHLKN